MSVFKVIFANHVIISCMPVDKPGLLIKKYVCEKVNGKPIYALIEAHSEEEAKTIANELLGEVTGGCESCL